MAPKTCPSSYVLPLVLGTGTRVPVPTPVTQVPVTYPGTAQYPFVFLEIVQTTKVLVWYSLSCRLPLLKVAYFYVQCRNIVSRHQHQSFDHNGAKYTRLVHLALKNLGIPTTSVPSEKLFSKAGEIVSRRRASLKPTAVDNLTCSYFCRRNYAFWVLCLLF